MQENYRKVDVISQEEFDSQRGVEEKESDQSDSDLVFSLDLQDKDPPPSASTEQPQPTAQAPASTPSRGGGRKEEKLARFYPVPYKQDTPSEVCEDVCGWVWVSVCVWGGGGL